MFKLPAEIERLLQYDPATLSVTTREGKHHEFKRDCNISDLSDYAKTLAAFSNAGGGVLIFGVGENPRRIVGVNHIVDEAQWANRLREDFDPEIVVSTRVYAVGALQLLAAGVDPSANGPVICRKSRSKPFQDKGAAPPCRGPTATAFSATNKASRYRGATELARYPMWPLGYGTRPSRGKS